MSTTVGNGAEHEPREPAHGGRPGRSLVNDLPRFGPMSRDLATPASALAVGAHPDDIEFGCGATLAKWAARGCRIHHLVLTDGSKGTWDPRRNPATLVATRQQEQRRAAELLGGSEVGFLGWPDGELRNGVREQWEVCRWIRTVRPHVVLGHDPWRRYRLHPDHRNAGFILTDAVVAARDPLFFDDQGLAPHRPGALLLWEADVPNHVEDVAGFESVKLEALLAHQSQHESTMGIKDSPAVPGNDRPGVTDGSQDPEDVSGTAAFARHVRSQLSEHGALIGVESGESFHLIDPS